MRRFVGLLACIVGCGGIAVVDGGAGGSDGTSGGPTSSTARSSSSVTTSGGTSQYCDEVCAALGPCVQTPDCVGSCQATAGNCAAQHDEWLTCVLQTYVSGCSFGPMSACNSQLLSFLECRYGALGPADCQIGPDSCLCSESAGVEKFQSLCYPSPVGVVCDCSAGDYVGACEQEFECLPSMNCCSALLFVVGL